MAHSTDRAQPTRGVHMGRRHATTPTRHTHKTFEQREDRSEESNTVHGNMNGHQLRKRHTGTEVECYSCVCLDVLVQGVMGVTRRAPGNITPYITPCHPRLLFTVIDILVVSSVGDSYCACYRYIGHVGSCTLINLPSIGSSLLIGCPMERLGSHVVTHFSVHVALSGRIRIVFAM